ncbi:MAG: hypothetical protein ACREPM_19795 [Gemmatimonadaceae bacterium]
MIDTYSSFVAGYTVAGAIILVYVASLWLRSSRLSHRLHGPPK